MDGRVFEGRERKLGIVTAGKSYGDVLEALRLLGLDETAAAAAGISLYKIGCIWPLEPEGARAFVDGPEMLLVIEEQKRVIVTRGTASRERGCQDVLALVGAVR